MATVVLGTIGSVIGGPIGGAIGTVIGSVIDNTVLAPGGNNEGPRLKELDVQTSSYGSDIPSIFGKMRVAGTVIWATDLQEDKKSSGGGKGRPSTTEYSYSVSMAVAISSRPVASIGRIWADGNLLRGEAGDFKSETMFRFYDGSKGQSVDPLIASAVGIENCPAYRGIAYVVFENLQLADFGNRIPQLTLEVIERDDNVSLSEIFNEVSAGIIQGDVAVSVEGYAAEGPDQRAALQPLVESCPISIFPQDNSLDMVEWPAPAQIELAVAAVRQNERQIGRQKTTRMRADELPVSITLRHYEPARDYQLGAQKSERMGDGFKDQQIALPATISADTAKNFADLKLLDIQHSVSNFEGSFVNDTEPLCPGKWLRPLGNSAIYRIDQIEHFHGHSFCRAKNALNQYTADLLESSPGVHVAAADLQSGATEIVAMDLPILNGNNVNQPIVAIAAAGTQAGWRSANISLQQGDNLVDLGSTASPAIIGKLSADLPAHQSVLIDNSNSVEIEFLHSGMQPIPSLGSPLLTDSPAIWVNGEIIRYGNVIAQENNRYRLANLLRGCFGTEASIGEHLSGQYVVFISENVMKTIDSRYASLGNGLTFEALGLGDDQPVSASLLVTGNALQPLAPVHGFSKLNGDGSRVFGWKRRSRIDLGWQDYVGPPLAEDGEEYIFTLLEAEQIRFQQTLHTSEKIFSSSEWASLGFLGDENIRAEVVQVGTYKISSVLEISI